VSQFRIFAAIVSGVSALILILTQTLGGPEEIAAPDIEPLPTISLPPPPTVAPTETVQPSPSPTESGDEPPPYGTIVYEHDFSDPANGLLNGQAEDSGINEFGARAAAYSNGGFLVRVESGLTTYVAGASSEGYPGGGLEDLGDVSIEADVTPFDYGAAATWGLACRRERGVGSFYYASLGDAGGHAGATIIRQDTPGGDWTEIASEPITAAVTIGSFETNHLRLDCIGSTITLYADGFKVVEGTDSTYRSGSIALFANPSPDAPADIAFDNLVIREAD
jgi:hypothetical protein